MKSPVACLEPSQLGPQALEAPLEVLEARPLRAPGGLCQGSAPRPSLRRRNLAKCHGNPMEILSEILSKKAFERLFRHVFRAFAPCSPSSSGPRRTRSKSGLGRPAPWHRGRRGPTSAASKSPPGGALVDLLRIQKASEKHQKNIQKPLETPRNALKIQEKRETNTPPMAGKASLWPFGLWNWSRYVPQTHHRVSIEESFTFILFLCSLNTIEKLFKTS